ncbi:iron chelate uptake ABC transporter family permease subunit [Ureaplasma diversum]|uniref:Ferrichrome ABC transporter n=1 Tax=Ureaplasma diversum NCTC 246 TaxID=1188241 RepID=A0A084EZL2_9BACT|nr:iron chelate uptake ABC transporter family permease subunit [Ureaplasma diversum]KEZ23404.1 Ferrichrome ABC transporter [Ureaplasma diversum NCTC 246]
MNNISYFKPQQKPKTTKKIIVSISLIIGTIGIILLSVGLISHFSKLFILWENWKFVLQLVISGICLGIGGFLVQRITKNRVVDTSLMGMGNFNLVLISCLLVFLDLIKFQNHQQLEYIFPFIFLLGSLIVSFLINYVAKDSGVFISKKIIIAGIIINLLTIIFAQSARLFMSLENSARIKSLVLGNIAIKSDFEFSVSSLFMLIAIVWLGLRAKYIEHMCTSELIAIQLGINTKQLMQEILVCLSLLVAASYSLNGNLVFVGIFASHSAFRITKNQIFKGIFISGGFGLISTLFALLICKGLFNLEANQTAIFIPLLCGVYLLINLFIKRRQ